MHSFLDCSIYFSQVFAQLGNGVANIIGPLLVPDWFIHNTTDPDYSLIDDTYLNRTIPTPAEVRKDIWWYMLLDAAVAVAILAAIVVYFPSKPPIPPSPTGAETR